jgi:hypothetical protein
VAVLAAAVVDAAVVDAAAVAVAALAAAVLALAGGVSLTGMTAGAGTGCKQALA